MLFAQVVNKAANNGNFTLLFCRERHGIVGKCVQHVQHAYFSLFHPIKFLICGVVVAVDAIDDAKIGSLSKDDGNGNANARKQWSDWLNEEK